MERIAKSSWRDIGSLWDRYEGPTWLVAAFVYVWWGLLIWFHADIPWWLMIPLGAFVIAWQNSLQHETIHALVRVPRPVRFGLGVPPLGLAVPYLLYCRSHRRHHRTAGLTDPDEDPESFYHREERWRGYPRAIRAVYLLNQTLLGRLTIGPVLYLGGFIKRETSRVVAGDCSNLPAWGWHAVCVGLLLFWVREVAGMPVWQYVLLVAYPGMCLGMLRSFGEHRYAAPPGHRTAIVESRFPLNVLFLNNNLHLVHHLFPALPWYRIPSVWRESRAELLEHNGAFYFAGYAQLAVSHAVRPVFVPVAPNADAARAVDSAQRRPAGAA